MDISLIIAFISPFLPYLVKLGTQSAEKLTDKASEQFSETAWEKAKVVWSKLRPQLEHKPAAAEAIEDTANHPDDEDLQAALRVQVKKLLQQDAALADEVAALLKADAPDGTPGTHIVQNVVGNRNQIIGSVQGQATYQN